MTVGCGFFSYRRTACNESGWQCRFIPKVFFYKFIIIHEQKSRCHIRLVNEEHPFHQAGIRPGKAKKHRHEGRKVWDILKVADWEEERDYGEAS